MPADNLSQPFTAEELETSIALIGMSCKFPDADNPETFWQNILTKKESIHFFTPAELIAAGITKQHINDPSYVAARGTISDIDKFDAPFFGYSPFEATITDPQHRIFLEQAWAALENAGYSPEQYPGLIGLFAGMADSTYLSHNLLKNTDFLAKYDEYQTMLATSSQFLSTKTAYAMGLTGPCININTACSTGLVTIILACQNLLNYDCDMALAGGISLFVPQQAGYLYQESGILSPDGHCRPFDNNAQGTVASNGCGIVVLKRLTDAIKANDNVVAIIKGWAINNDGAQKVGFTAPSVNGQATCIEHAIAFANIDPTDVEYIEAHGTGTVLGDPIEIAALTKGYQYNTYLQSQYCAISSVKSNIGHTDVAAGIAGFIKTAKALQEKILPPTLHYNTPNEKINFSKSPFYVNQTAQPWHTEKKRTAAVNSLGIGGTNAHLIMQEAPQIKFSSPTKSANILILSAKTPTALAAISTKIHHHLLTINTAETTLADIAYTLQLGRKHFKYRRAIPYTNLNEIHHAFAENLPLYNNINAAADKQHRRIIFGFTGQGSQYANMVLDLYQQHPDFKKIIDECCDYIQDDLEIDLRELLFPAAHNVQYANETLRDTRYAQPALFIIEYALTQLLFTLGIKPNAMIGHSIGEYVAATLANVIKLQDALTLVTTRGWLMSQTQPGAMLAIPLAKEQIINLLPSDLALAANNAPELCVVAGATEKITQFENILKTKLDHNLICQKLHVSHAFHSPLMDDILEKFLQITGKFSYGTPQIPYISNVTGSWINDNDLKNEYYWTEQLRHTVHFSEGVKNLQLSADDIFIEIGPGQTLINLIKQHQNNKKISTTLNILPAAKEYQSQQIDAYYYFLNTISKLWLQGIQINWKALYNNETRRRVPLPTYCFDDHRYWINPSVATIQLPAINKLSPDLLYTITWERDLNLQTSNHSFDVLDKKDEQCWLLFTNEEIDLIKKIKSTNSQVYTVATGKTFIELADDAFVIAPDNKADYLRLLQKIKFTETTLSIIHSWSLSNHSQENVATLQQGAYSLLYLSQAFTETYPDKNLKITVLSNHIQNVLGSEKIFPEKATILGPCKVIPQEQENIFYKFIDIDAEKITAALTTAVYAEANNVQPDDYKKELAYRGNYRWLKRFQPCATYLNTHTVDRLKSKGVYLITGGLGGIGLSLAHDLALNYKANLVLIARSSFLPEADWEKNDIKDANLTKKIASLKEIKSNAASLTIMQAAVQNESEMQPVIDFMLQKFGRIDGVIHTAGVAGSGIAQLKTIAEYNKILQPKLAGTQTLVKLLKDQPLDFFALFSSITAINGYPGQIDYCSANLVLDAYANTHSFTHPVFCVSMNWQAWQKVGMAADSTTNITDFNENNSTAPELAVSLFKKIINSDLNQVIISGTQPDQLDARIKNKKKHDIIPIKTTEKLPANLDSITQTITNLWHEVLGIEQVALDDNFYQLGGNSLLAISLLTKMQRAFNIKIATTTLFKAKTIRALASIIKTNIQEQEISPLVTLLEGGDKSPLFMLHPVGGTVFCYLPTIQHLTKDRTIYGLQDPSIEKEKSLFDSLEEMATAYREAIQKIQPSGPYYLCGASFGGNLAFEIARQLLEQKQVIAFLGLIDSWPEFSTMQRDKNYFDIIIEHHQEDKNLRALPQETNNPTLWKELLQRRIAIMLQYKPKKLAVKLTLFKACEILPQYQEIDTYDNHWSAYSTFPVEIYKVSGNHSTMLQEPNVAELTIHLQKCLNNS